MFISKFMKPLVLSALFLGVTPLSFAGYSVQVDEGHIKMVMNIDDKGMIEIKGLPVEDKFYYDSVKARMYVRAPHVQQAYYINVLELASRVVEGEFVSPLDAPRSHALGFNTRKWSASAYGKFCHNVDGSVQMADRLGLDVKDMKRIGMGIGFILAQDFDASPCSYYKVPNALASIVGFPMKITHTANGINTEVISVIEDETFTELQMPQNAIQLDEEAYIGFLKRRLSKPALSSFIRTEPMLDTARLRVKALKQLLKDPNNRRSFSEKIITKGNVYGGPKAKTMVIKDLAR